MLYTYTSDLLCLDLCRPCVPTNFPDLLSVSTPLNVQAWEAALQSYPDRAYAQYIILGLRLGFRIGFQRKAPLKSSLSNMPSAALHADTVSQYLTNELSLGRFLGPFPMSRAPSLHVSRFGVIPKGHNTGKWRLITDMSSPHNQSVNDGIDPTLCSLSYITTDDVAEIVTTLGTGSLMAKIDIESAYRLIPVHPDDRPLQAVQWEGQVFIDTRLPFGLRSAPKIFNAVADALCLYLRQCDIKHT